MTNVTDVLMHRHVLPAQESPEGDKVDRGDPNYDSGEEKRALAFHSRKVEQIKAYKQAVSPLEHNCWKLAC